MRRIVKAEFFARDAHAVAKDLLGMYIVRKKGTEEYAVQILDVEVYDGFDDKASHARAGVTPRTSIMYGPAGVWYVYLCYGIHSMLNIVTREEGYPSAILIRGVEKAQGPGVVTRSLEIDRSFNALSAQKKNDLWIEDRGKVGQRRIHTLPRVGVAYAGPVWASRKWRYVLER